jgi:excisionase family DNA binding protein
MMECLLVIEDPMTSSNSKEGSNMNEQPAHLTTGQAAAALQVSSETIRRWANQGLLKSYRLPSGQLRIQSDNIETLRKKAEQ